MRTLVSVDRDPVTGMETRWFYDSADRKIHVQRLQDVEENLNANQAEFNSYGDHRNFKGHLHKMASIPNAIYEKWLREDGFDALTGDDKELRRRLNSSEFRKLRTMPGKL